MWPQFFEYSRDGELRYNTRTPAGCIMGDGISTYLTVELCRERGKPVPANQKFIFRKVGGARVRPLSPDRIYYNMVELVKHAIVTVWYSFENNSFSVSGN